jgi:tetratricopeptide (TPR) repeat protein
MIIRINFLESALKSSMEGLYDKDSSQKPLSTHWQLPARLATFTGRATQLEQLCATYQIPNQRLVIQQAQKTQKISGTGGIGKTQLTVEFAHQMIDSGRFSKVVWLNATSVVGDQLENEIRLLAHSMHLETKQIDTQTLLMQIYKILTILPNTLVIFDNALNYPAVAKYLPKVEFNLAVLVTTRDGVLWSEQFQQLALDIFEPNEALEFIRKVLPEHLYDREFAGSLANQLGYFPLALSQATAYIKTRNISIEDYLKLYEQKKSTKGKLLDNKALASDPHQETIWVTVQLALEKLKESTATKILHLSAYLAPEVAIDCELLSAVDETTPMTDSAFAEIKSYSLMEEHLSDRHVKMHQLVQEILRISDNEAAELSILDQMSALIVNHFDKEGLPLVTEKRQTMLLPHIVCVLEYIKPHISNNAERYREKVALLHAGLGGIYFKQGQYKQQIDSMQKALEYYEAYKPDAANIIKLLCGMAPAYDMLGDYKKSEQLQVLVLNKINQRLTKDCSLYAYHATSNLGARALMMSDYKSALEFFQKADNIAKESALYITEVTFRPLLNSSIASALRGLGQWQQALDMQMESLQTLRSLFGEEHSDVAIALDSLSKTYQMMRNFELSEKYSREALDITTRLFGEKHPRLAMQLDNYATNLYLLKQYDLAIESHKKAEQLFIYFYGEHHAETAVTYICLANCYDNKNEPLKAREYLLRAKEITKGSLGGNNPRYASILFNLARTYCNEEGTVAEHDILIYREYLEECLRIRIKYYGEHNFNVATTLHQLAQSYNKDQIGRRLKLLSMALPIMVKTCGQNDIRTIKTLFMLAETQLNIGETEAALRNYVHCYPVLMNQLGPNHSHATRCVEHIRLLSEIHPNLLSAATMRFFKPEPPIAPSILQTNCEDKNSQLGSNSNQKGM